MKLRVGDWVEIKSKKDILRTLDKRGCLEGLPFMPQMFQFCGKQYKVFKRAHKTCDTIGYYRGGGRLLKNGVHLEIRCDGTDYDGCKAACLLFWKEAWLNPLSDKSSIKGRHFQGNFPVTNCTELDVLTATRAEIQTDNGDIKYSCQATELLNFTTYVAWWDFRQYIEDFISGNASIGRIVSGFFFACYYYLLKERYRSAIPFHWLYDKFQSVRGGCPYPGRRGVIPIGQTTPSSTLNLLPGEVVRIKSYEEILTTLDKYNRNRGLHFDVELVPYCKGNYRVKCQVDKFIDEKTGKMSFMKTPAVILEDVWCRSRYSQCRLFCPRSIYSWWREIWLERVRENIAQSTEKCE
jgi:hypothetical protein